tara:strand:- start:10878 stop:11765 length:888 start_codon:yes stop_codon:yes gene_type:complete
MSKQIQLHCPSTKRTVDAFVISPFQNNDQILQGIRLALGIPHASIYTVSAKPLTKLDSLQDSQRVLIAASPAERMLPDSPPEFEFYDGQDADDTDPDLDGYLQPWDSLSEREKCDHINSLNERKPTTRNKLRITRQWQPVLDDLTAVQGATAEQMAGQFPGAQSEALMEQRWRTTVDHFLPEAMKPARLKAAGRFWDERVVAALAVLSSFTQGQARLGGEVLLEAVRLRMVGDVDATPVVRLQDVVDAVTIVYERAGVVPARLTKARSAKGKGKERRKALKERRKGNGGMGGIEC